MPQANRWFSSCNFLDSYVDYSEKMYDYPQLIHIMCPDPSCSWFLGNDDGTPSVEDVYPTLVQQPLYFPQSQPVFIAMGSAKRERSACRIQREWRIAISDPKRIVCRKRLLKEFAELSEPDSLTEIPSSYEANHLVNAVFVAGNLEH